MGNKSTIAGLDASKLADAQVGFHGMFYMQLEQSRAEWEPLIRTWAMPVDSDNAKEIHNWIGPPPKMREWKGDRPMDILSAHGIELANLEWANGLQIGVPDIRRDKLGQYQPRIAGLADEGWRHKYEQLIDLLKNGFTAVCYTGVSFFNSAHPRGGGSTYDNAMTDALSVASLKTAILKLRAARDVKGRKLRNKPTHLTVAGNLEWTAKDILQKETILIGGQPETNTARGAVPNLMIEGELPDNYWFVSDLSRNIKPLISQTEEEITADEMALPTSEPRFRRNVLEFGAHYAGNAGYALPELVVGSDGST